MTNEIKIIEITIKEFKKEIYQKYKKLFPKNERRPFKKVKRTYELGIEKFYKIIYDNNIIGFFMLEKLNDNYPSYLDYFGIFKEYQNKGYGSKSLIQLINLISPNGICGEIEKIDDNNITTVKRYDFYKRIGFKKIDSEYSLYHVLYTPLIYSNKEYKKDEIDKILFDYYELNCGLKELKKYCKKIK